MINWGYVKSNSPEGNSIKSLTFFIETQSTETCIHSYLHVEDQSVSNVDYVFIIIVFTDILVDRTRTDFNVRDCRRPIKSRSARITSVLK